MICIHVSIGYSQFMDLISRLLEEDYWSMTHILCLFSILGSFLLKTAVIEVEVISR